MGTTPVHAREQFASIQYLRALGTLTVVAAHAHTPLFSFGEAAVSLFFIISGFVMVYVSRRETTPGRFLRARILRVVPLYWCVTLFVAAAYGSDLSHLLQSLVLWPHLGPSGRGWPVVGQGWTLVYETYFYLIFALSLLGPFRLRVPFITAVLAALVAVGQLIHPASFALSIFTSPLLLDFVAGALVFALWHQGRLPSGLRAAALLGIAVLSVSIQAAFGAPAHNLPVWGVAGTLMLSGALGLERSGLMPVLPALHLIGDASYSIYLTQFFAVNALQHRLAAWPASARVPLTLVAATLLGLACYGLLERPLRRLGAARLPAASKQTARQYS